jgi:hypothetical protein
VGAVRRLHRIGRMELFAWLIGAAVVLFVNFYTVRRKHRAGE